MLKRVLIANRGEIALRILRGCRELGIETVAVYSQADADALHVQLAGQAVCIGPARAADSYLNQDALLTVAKATGCDGVHPGYGFLSENADFADACAREGITFIGPSGDTIRKAGSKSAARDIMRAAGVPVTPGSDGPVASVEEALTAAESVGYPVLLKASAGGGGRGIRRCDSSKDLPDAYAAAKAEANACFGNDEMYLEKLVLEPRHIEFQILADRYGNVIHLGDRDCSVQRRNQKLIEEAPARCLTPELRERMGAAAVKAAKAVGYENAGTVEFLLDPGRELTLRKLYTKNFPRLLIALLFWAACYKLFIMVLFGGVTVPGLIQAGLYLGNGEGDGALSLRLQVRVAQQGVQPPAQAQLFGSLCHSSSFLIKITVEIKIQPSGPDLRPRRKSGGELRQGPPWGAWLRSPPPAAGRPPPPGSRGRRR